MMFESVIFVPFTSNICFNFLTCFLTLNWQSFIVYVRVKTDFVSFTLLFTTNNNFNFHIRNFLFPSRNIDLCPPMVFLFNTLHDIPGFAHLMNVLF